MRPHEAPSTEGPYDPPMLTGKSERHLCSQVEADDLGASVHAAVVRPFLRLRDAARRDGFDLRVDSGFRSFARQTSIWNRKATGQLAVLDSEANPLEVDRLTDRDLVYAILRWSALPGASRHHWGTDLDVYDESARPDEYQVDLIPEEVDDGGMFAPLHDWLDRRIRMGEAHGFFRPYDEDRRGVAPERWHLSHAPTARRCEAGLTIDVVRATISASDIELRSTVLAHLDDLYERFVINTNRKHE